MLVTKTIYQTIEMCYPSALADDSTIRLTFTLDTKAGKGIALSGGGVFKGQTYIGSFDGFVGFAHNVTGENKEAVDTLLSELSEELHRSYDVPMPVDELEEG